MHILSVLRRFRYAQGGATAVEYGLIAGILTLGVVVGMRTVSTSMETNLKSYSNTIDTAKDSTAITSGGGD